MQPAAADFEEIKRRTEAVWAGASLRPGIYGFQIQPGTRWNPGLRPDEIDAYERALGVRFPASFRCMLSVMNGTDLPTLNLYGTSEHPAREGVGVYAYPRDLALVREWMEHVRGDRDDIAEVLREEGLTWSPTPHWYPCTRTASWSAAPTRGTARCSPSWAPTPSCMAAPWWSTCTRSFSEGPSNPIVPKCVKSW